MCYSVLPGNITCCIVTLCVYFRTTTPWCLWWRMWRMFPTTRSQTMSLSCTSIHLHWTGETLCHSCVLSLVASYSIGHAVPLQRALTQGEHSALTQCGHSALTQCGHSALTQCGHSALTQCGHSAQTQCGHSALTQCGHSALTQCEHSALTQCGHSALTQCGHSALTQCRHSVDTMHWPNVDTMHWPNVDTVPICVTLLHAPEYIIQWHNC